MTVEEVGKRKKKLEESIESDLARFRDETGCCAEVQVEPYYLQNSKDTVVRYKVKVVAFLA